MRGLLAVLGTVVLLSTALAGCVDPAPGAPGAPGVDAPLLDEQGRAVIPEGWAELVFGGGEGHDHRNTKQHQGLSTPNFVEVGYNPLITDWHGITSGDYFCGGYASDGERALAVVHSFGTDVAFVLADVSDPSNPKKLGELVMQNTQVYDTTISPDLRFVLLSTSPLESGPTDLPVEPPTAANAGYGTLLWRDACTGEERVVDGPEAGLPFASGIVLVNIDNPLNPYVADFKPFPVLGGHSIRAYDNEGTTLLLVSVPNANHASSYYVFMEIDPDTPTGGTMMVLSAYQWIPENPADYPATGGSGMHDGYIQKHPVTGELLAYLAYGDQGLVTLNIDDPAQPQFLGHWAEWEKVPAAVNVAHYVHEALPITQPWDGRHYTFIGEECISRTEEAPTCIVYTLDTTDPTDIQLVSAWTVPVDVQWDNGLMYSLHYLQLVNRTLFATMYHGGVWAIDVSTPQALLQMPTIGVFLPSRESPRPMDVANRDTIIQQEYGAYGLEYSPTVLDLEIMADGTMIVFDGPTGLYTVRFDPTYPAPPPPAWPMGYAGQDVAAEAEPADD